MDQLLGRRLREESSRCRPPPASLDLLHLVGFRMGMMRKALDEQGVSYCWLGLGSQAVNLGLLDAPANLGLPPANLDVLHLGLEEQEVC